MGCGSTGRIWSAIPGAPVPRSSRTSVAPRPVWPPPRGKLGVIVWEMRSPYVFVGGRLEAEGPGPASRSPGTVRSGRRWERTWTPCSRARGPARYHYFLRCELSGVAARLRRLTIINDLQMAPLALPGMRIGENPFVYTDESAEPRTVRVTHDWVERSASTPPAAPPTATLPAGWGRGRGHRSCLQVAASRRCRRLPLRTLRIPRYALAPLAQLP